MINLLPPDLKEAYRYAHRNVRLVRWAVACGIGLIGLALISTAGLIYVQQATRAYAQQVRDAQTSLKDQNQTGVETQVKSITDSLKLAVQVLSKEVLFSKLLTQLASITPDNAVLTDLNISQAQTAVDITALTTDYAAATQLQVNLADPSNQIFSRADIISIICNAANSGSDARYPCTVTIRALFVSNNPFLFINDGGKHA